MLVLTTRALSGGSAPADLFADWPGPHVLVVLPRSGLTRAERAALADRFIVIERLSMPRGLHDILRDVAQFLPEALRLDEGPLLCLDRVPSDGDKAVTANAVGPLEVAVETDEEGQARRVVLGDLISTSPLFPRFFKMLDRYDPDGPTFFKLLADAFVWDAE